jgi:hypothetical protein
MKFFSVVTVLSSMAVLLSNVSAVHLNTEAENRVEQMESLYADLLSDEEAMEEWGFDFNMIKRKIAQAKRWARIEAAKARRRIARAIKKVKSGNLQGAIDSGLADIQKTMKEGGDAAKWAQKASKDTGINVANVSEAINDAKEGKINPLDAAKMAGVAADALEK